MLRKADIVGQTVVGKYAHILHLLARHQLAADRSDMVDEDNLVGALDGRIDGEQSHNDDYQSCLFEHLTNRCQFSIFVSFNEAARQAPGTYLGRVAALGQNDSVLTFDQTDGYRLGVVPMDKAAGRSGTGQAKTFADKLLSQAVTTEWAEAIATEVGRGRIRRSVDGAMAVKVSFTDGLGS